MTPGLTAPQTAGFAQPHIRGVGSSTDGPGLEQPVATYIDGVYIAAAPGSLMTLNNIERIEVLKGPQGTLFGRNATGGLIQVVTRDPTDKSSAAFNLTYANYKDIVADAYLSGGLTGNLKADVAVRYETQQNGWGRNLATGNATENLPHDFAGRIKFLMEPSTTTQIRLALDYEDRISRRDTQHSDVDQIPFFYNSAPFGGPYPQGGKYDINSEFDPQNSLKAGGVSLSVDQGIGAVTLRSITAYRDLSFVFDLNIDETPANLIRLIGNTRDKQFSQEFQLSSTGSGKFVWTAGIYYFHADDRYDPLDIRLGPVFSPVRGVPAVSRTDDRELTDSVAAYGQATYEFLPQTRLTLGGRYSYERKRLSGVSSFFIGATDVGDTAIPDPATGIPTSTNVSRFNYRISLDHRFGPDVLAYLSYNTGFKSGGYNLAVPANTPYAPEDIKAIEVGLKNELFNRRVRLNGAGYYYWYRNIQVGRYINNSEAITNGAAARVYGLDFDAEFVVGGGLSLTAGAAYNHARFTSFPGADFIRPVNGVSPPPGGTIPGDAAGNTLPFAPGFTFDVGADYRLKTSVGTFELNATYFRTSRYFSSPDNFIFQPAYDLLNVSLGWSSVTNNLTAKVWAKNLENTFYSTSLITGGAGGIRSLGAPRTYGVTVGFRF